MSALKKSFVIGGERQALKKSAKTLSDGFTLGALSAALRFCRPFLKVCGLEVQSAGNNCSW